MRKFRTLSGQHIPNVVEYIKEYINRKDPNEEIDILIGCDSQSFGHKKTVYGLVVVLHHRTKGEGGRGKGGHVLCHKEIIKPAEKVTPVRLLNEVWKSVELANELTENGIQKPKFIDIDLNPDPKYRSNKVLREAIGLVEGMGYKARWKHEGVMATYSANLLARS